MHNLSDQLSKHPIYLCNFFDKLGTRRNQKNLSSGRDTIAFTHTIIAATTEYDIYVAHVVLDGGGDCSHFSEDTLALGYPWE